MDTYKPTDVTTVQVKVGVWEVRIKGKAILSTTDEQQANQKHDEAVEAAPVQ